MNTLSGYSKSTLSDLFVLTAAGGHLAVGNANGNIPLNNGTTCTNLKAQYADQLTTTRTIWGQNFNGTSNVDGTLHLNASGNSYTQGIRIYQNSTGYAGILLGSKDLTSKTSTDSNSWFVSTNTDAYFSISKGGYLPTDSTSFGYDGTNWRANNKIILTEGNYKSYVDNLYWANLPIQQATDATTHPTFGNATVSGTVKARDVIINGGTGSNIQTRAVLVLNSPSGKAADIVFKCNSTSTGSYGQWAISSRSDDNYRLGIWRGSENGSTASEKELFTILANGNVGIDVKNPDAKLQVNGSVRVQYNTPWLYIKDTNTDAETYSIISFGNSSNDYAAYIFLNGSSRTNDGGANTMTIRNNVGSLRLNNDTEVTGLLTTSYNSSHKGIKIGNAYINAIDGNVIFQNNTALRFGGDDWDWNVWAGLRYIPSNKTIHLGLADNDAFTANSAQSGGTLNLPGISHILSSYYRIATGHILQHTHTTTGGWYRVAKLKGYFNFDIHVSGGWSTGMPSVIKVNVCQINGTAKITQLSGYVGQIGSSIRLGKVATNEWDVLFYSAGQSSGTLAQHNFTFFGIGDVTTYTTNTISTTSYTSTTDLAFATLTGISLTTDNYTTYLDTRYYTKTQQDDIYVNTAGDTMTGTLTMYTTGTGSYNHGIRINRVKTSDWALLLIGKSGTATSGTGTSTVGDGAWLIGTPASSNSLIFNLNDASESKGLCLKGHGTSDIKWNNNTVWHAGNDGSGSGLDADLLDGNHASAFATSGHNHDSSYVRYATVAKSTADSTNAKPYIYNIESETVISGYYGYWYILNLGQHSGGNFGTQLAMPYQDTLTDSELFIRSAKSGTWRDWRRVIHSNNYTAYTVTKTGGGASGTWSINVTGSAGSVAWSNVTGKPSSFTPSSHNHDTLYVKYGQVTKATVDGSNNAPYMFNVENETLVTNYKNYWYVLNFGSYSGGNYRAQLAMPYQSDLGDSELFIRNWSSSWRTWRRVLHEGNSSVSKSGQTLTVKINGTSQSLTNSTYNFAGVSFTSGQSDTGEHNCNSITSNGHWYYNSNGPSGLGEQSTDGALYSQAYSTSWVGQIAQDYRNGNLFTRSRKDGTWQAWKAVAYKTDIPSTSNFVTISGAQTITGKKTFSNNIAISGGATENTALPYFLGIDAYADGGTVRYICKENICACIGASKSGHTHSYNDLTNKPTIPTVSSRNLTVNGTAYTFYSNTTTAAASFYAPTSVGTNGYILQSLGVGTPTWTSRLSYDYPGIIWIGYIYRSARSYTTWYTYKQAGSATVTMYISSPTSTNNYQVAMQSSTHYIVGGICSIRAQFNAGKDGGQSTEGPLYAYSTVDVNKIEEAGPDVFVTTVHNGYFYIKALRASDANNTSYYFDGLAFTGAGKDTNALPLAQINVILFGY